MLIHLAKHFSITSSLKTSCPKRIVARVCKMKTTIFVRSISDANIQTTEIKALNQHILLFS
jgi:hypothetical protein